MMHIEYLDAIHCKADKEAVKAIKGALEYDSVFWQKGVFKKKRVDKKAYMVDGRSGIFLSGLLPRVIDEGFDENNIDYSNWELFEPERNPKLKGVSFRDYQLEAINVAIKEQRGVIKAATGTGKSIIAMGLMSCYPRANILFLCHSIAILEQMASELKEKGLKANFIRGKEKQIKKGINIASIQTFSKIDAEKYDTFFDITMIDELHHVNSRSSQYGIVLQRLLSPLKVGFSATLPETREKILCLEGLVGDVIFELTINEGEERGMFVKPRIKLIPVPYQSSLADLYQYQEIYREGVVESKIRNNLIVNEAIELILKNKSCLILIKDLQHAENLLDVVYEKFPNKFNDFVFIKGETSKEDREAVRQALNKKEIKCVISSVIWVEGIDIPTLDSVIIAAGGKSDIRILQSIGRTTRQSEGKKEAIIVDFVDQAKYLASHMAKRLCLYLENGWLK